MEGLSTAQLIGFLLAISVPSFTALAAMLVNNARLSDLRSDIDARFEQVNQRFNHTDALFTERLRRVEEVMDARLTRIEDQLRIR